VKAVLSFQVVIDECVSCQVMAKFHCCLVVDSEVRLPADVGRLLDRK